ncbi:hypothetical protein AKJ09_11268 [Labilithrix luteola]|uniref:Lipoprotein n=1 Tax=Labilithrix luteola TaxID=1391654 RepID=A0A0K1QGP1_9BACT|nr:hypothetical protein AKJ09_11268 [Labilithrix luteola]
MLAGCTPFLSMGVVRVLPLVLACGLVGCLEPPPKIAAIPANGLAVRVHVFGASAIDARHAFEAVKVNNPRFSLVERGGDGEILVGIENESPRCVAPTGLCKLHVAYRIKDKNGQVLKEASTTVAASGPRCGNLCEQALTDAVVKVVEAASESIEQGQLPPGLGTKTASKPSERPLCSVGAGPRLQSDEAERRAAQVEALKRMGVVEREDYDCLRKAYLDRL